MGTRQPAAPSSAVPRHPIQVVARRTGLSAEVIRAWEKRYDVVEPVRSSTGRRLYSDADVDRLQLLARATLSGRAIGQVAALTPGSLAALMRDDAATVAPAVSARFAIGSLDGAEVRPLPERTSTLERMTACLNAVERFDVVSLDVSLRRAVVALSAEGFLDTLIVPLWKVVLSRVQDGTLRRAHEHVASSALRRALDRVVEAATSSLAAPELVVTTPLGQPQELGALLVTATAAAEGERALYLGPGVPAEAIADATVSFGARSVALSLGDSTSNRLVSRELHRLRALLPLEIIIYAEGAATDAHRGVLREIGAIVLHDAAMLRSSLRQARARREFGATGNEVAPG